MALRERLDGTHFVGRLEATREVGRRAKREEGARAEIDALARGDAYARYWALLANHGLHDGARVVRAISDGSRRVRGAAFALAPLCCSDAEAQEALDLAHAMRKERQLARGFWLRGRADVVDRFLDRLATRPGLHDFADLVPFATPEGVRRHLARALERPSFLSWERLARFAPESLGEVLLDALKQHAGEPDPVTRHNLDRHLPAIAAEAPDAALPLVDLMASRKIRPAAVVWKHLARQRPSETLALAERHEIALPRGALSKSWPELGADELERAVRRDPTLLGASSKIDDDLGDDHPRRAAVIRGWLAALGQHATWGEALIRRIDDPAARDAAYQAWSTGARTDAGTIALPRIAKLPPDLRAREARRHLHDVVSLGTRPDLRVPYARYLPWDEAEKELRSYTGHPEGTIRGLALAAQLAIPGLLQQDAEKALALVQQRKNEQDPVRLAMLQALVAWPRAVWRTEHTAAIGQIFRDALDAGDLSMASAQAAEQLLIRTFRLDPAWGAKWLSTFVKERGQIHSPRLGEHLTDDEVRAAAPALLEVARAWGVRERAWQLVQLAQSLGDRLRLVPGLADVLDAVAKDDQLPWVALGVATTFRAHDRPRYDATLGARMRLWFDKGWLREILSLADSNEKPTKRQPPLHPELVAAVEKLATGNFAAEHVLRALDIMARRATARFDEILPGLLEKDPSIVICHCVQAHLHRRRQDLLGPFLGERVITGRFASGKTRWLLPFEDGFHRWNVAQNETFAAALGGLTQDRERDTPTVWRATAVLAALDWSAATQLATLANDDRAAIKERAIRVMSRCDQGQCVPVLLECLGDGRARFAIYSLRRAISGMPPSRALEILAGAPMNKVTVAKEVLRLIGTLRSDGAYTRLIELDGTRLHRDVRIALLRALWDHLDKDPTWGVFERAVTGDDPTLAGRAGDIPADRLTAATDRKLSALLAKVLGRPEPEARIELLGRAAMLAVRDPEKTFLRACFSRLASRFDDEVRAAMRAVLHRAQEIDVPLVEVALRGVASDRRCLHVALDTLFAIPVKQRGVHRLLAEAAERVTGEDERLIPLHVRSAACARDPADLAAHVAELGAAGRLTADALEQCRAAIAAMPFDALFEVATRLRASASPAARRAAVWALARDAGPERGWTPERLAMLEALDRDPAPEVAAAASAIFPPRELALSTRPTRPGAAEAVSRHLPKA